MQTQSELRLQTLVDEREANHKLHETVIQAVSGNENRMPSESQAEQIEMYREKRKALDEEIAKTTEEVEAHRKAVEASKNIRRALAATTDGVEANDDGIVYRSMSVYARDVILTSQGTTAGKIQAQFGSPEEIQQARERLDLLKRVPANTLSSNVAGLAPAQHISQIFQVIQTARPLVAAATNADLVRGSLTYPRVDTRPVVAVQSSEKTEAGNTGMAISMQTKTATTYLGGGDLSWQAVNWSTPNALDLWFQFAASDYALKTEQDAAQSMQHSGFTNVISSGALSATPTFAEFMTAIGAGYAKVYSVSGRIADTVFMAPDRFGYLLGLTSNAFTQFTNVSGSNIGPLNVVVTRGMDAGVIVVGNASGLLVAETPGAPVELRVTEPAIGGYEVGIIGAFASVVVDNGSFSMITTAS